MTENVCRGKCAGVEFLKMNEVWILDKQTLNPVLMEKYSTMPGEELRARRRDTVLNLEEVNPNIPIMIIWICLPTVICMILGALFGGKAFIVTFGLIISVFMFIISLVNIISKNDDCKNLKAKLGYIDEILTQRKEAAEAEFRARIEEVQKSQLEFQKKMEEKERKEQEDEEAAIAEMKQSAQEVAAAASTTASA